MSFFFIHLNNQPIDPNCICVIEQTPSNKATWNNWSTISGYLRCSIRCQMCSILIPQLFVTLTFHIPVVGGKLAGGEVVRAMDVGGETARVNRRELRSLRQYGFRRTVERSILCRRRQVRGRLGSGGFRRLGAPRWRACSTGGRPDPCGRSERRVAAAAAMRGD